MTRRRTRSAPAAVARKAHAWSLHASLQATPSLLQTSPPLANRARHVQPAADSDVDDGEPRPSRECKPPERSEVDDLRSRATGKRWPAHSCCPNHMDTDPSTTLIIGDWRVV